MTRPFVRGARSLSREFALAGIFNWLMTQEEERKISANILSLAMDGLEKEDFERCDKAFFEELLSGVIHEASALENAYAQHTNRDITRISPVERSIMMMAIFEMQHHLETPYRVILNEAIQLAKNFGGNDGFKFVNGVLDKVAQDIRQEEQKN